MIWTVACALDADSSLCSGRQAAAINIKTDVECWEWQTTLRRGNASQTLKQLMSC